MFYVFSLQITVFNSASQRIPYLCKIVGFSLEFILWRTSAVVAIAYAQKKN